MNRAHIEIPEGFVARREGAGLFVHSGSVGFGIAPMAAAKWRATVKHLQSLPEAQVEAFAAGEFTGYRISREGQVRSYMLRGQGHFVMLSLSCAPALVEPLLPTLQFTAGIQPCVEADRR